MSRNQTNYVWKSQLNKVREEYGYISKPRDMEVREILNGSYCIPMPAYLNLKSRKLNEAFMFAEASWIISGNNRLEYVKQYMSGYKEFSDDQVFLRGAYGPKVVDQLPYVVDAIEKDRDTRQAVLTTWRERPAPSKDIPCTISMQFIVRSGKLHAIVNMRSHDIVLGFTYDVFTFSMVAKSVQLLLKERGIDVELGDLFVNAGSLHMYQRHYEQSKEWEQDNTSEVILDEVIGSLNNVQTYNQLIVRLDALAQSYKRMKAEK